MSPTEKQGDTRQRLLRQGLDSVRRTGLRGLVVREVAAAAGVNPGSFVYHFGSRERFISELVELWYAPIYRQLRQTASLNRSDDALEALRAVLEQLLQLAAEHAGFAGHLVADALAGERAAQAFLLRLPSRHVRLLLVLISRARRQGRLADAPAPQLLCFLVSAMGLPLLLARGPLASSDWLPPSIRQLQAWMADIPAARQRLAWALAGIGRMGEKS
ncbi:TetR/AcrR family transcriptional regulator [Chromobacterium alticapitis]|uniref:TetR/AcrR family transcriptional regulator n=1 Tax=Chromobacterium alticapitis TaxID=2073169 RepID=A0A2S5DHD1_9NEIS|nr:TetR/AcrR family transcriptional regulator [Chromobacterium alticapitis]POZ62421.1 TetR/AcrR family transcriptional regulator [Chromobacterium alticapitis]